MATYAFPTAVELKEIERVFLPTLTMDDPIFAEFPIVEKNSWRLKWRQRDNFQGLQQVRGMGGEFKNVEAVALKEYDVEPGVYGEFGLIEEEELTEAAQLDSFTDFIPINDLVGDRTMQMMGREVDRIRKSLWDLCSLGLYQVFDKSGSLKHTGTFPLLTQSAAVAWATAATATPFADLVSVRLKARGQAADFGRGKAFMNAKTFGYLMGNTNAADLFGRRSQYGATINNLGDVNKLIKEQSGNNDIPELVIYDKGYYSDGYTDSRTKGTWYPFIPDNKVVIFGRRDSGASLGEYRVTRNANNPNSGPGFYTNVRDLSLIRVPKAIQIEKAHSGGPVCYFPGAILILSV